MIELADLKASQVQAGGCGKYRRQINRLVRIYQGGTMPDDQFDFVLDILVNDLVECEIDRL
jgi:hypothetical protein